MRFKFPWQPLKWIFYDIEISTCIPEPGKDLDPSITYCKGWDDHAAMQIACIATYSSWDRAYRIFEKVDLPQFQRLVNRSDRVIGFNSISFDDKVCTASGLKIRTSYDLLSQVWVAAGLPPTYTKGVTKSGYSLEKLAQANLGMGKSGSGSLAPMLWQRGQKEEVKAYCLRDVFLSVALLNLGWQEKLFDPNLEEWLTLAPLN